MSDKINDIGDKISRAASEVELLKLGIEGLDDIVGGFPDKSVIFLVGEPGCNNTTFAQQVLWNRAEMGSKVSYYLVGTTALTIRQDMLTYGWELENIINKKYWNFVNVFTPEMKELLLSITPPNQESINVEANLNALKRDFLPKAQSNQWTVLDSVTYLLLEYSPRDVFNFVSYLTTAAHIHGGVHFLIGYEGVHEEHVINTIKLLCDGVIEFALKESTRGFEGSINIKKMRKSFRTKIVPFYLSERGITVETTVRIA